MEIRCVIGKTGVGKTTITNKMSREKGVKAIFIGQKCRQKFGEGNISRMSNASAPEELDKYINEMIMTEINRSGALFPDVKTLILDGYPRKPSQVNFLFNLIEYGHHVEILFLTCDEAERIQRLDVRDCNDDQRKLTTERNKVESKNLLDTLIAVSATNNIDKYIPINFVNTDALTETVVKDRMGLLFALNNRLSNMTIHRFGLSMEGFNDSLFGIKEADQMHETLVWVRRFIKKQIEELEEALSKMPDCWWSIDKIKLDPVRVELIDALHFMLSSLYAMGIDETGMMKLYCAKNKINKQRQESKNYSKVYKVEDDKHISL